MKRSDRLATLALLLGVCTVSADTVQLRGGRRMEGTFLGGDTRQIKLLGADGKVQTLDIGEVESITFQGAAGASPAPKPPTLRPASGTRPAAAAPAPATRAVAPAGAVITVRMIDAVDSEVNSTGERFKASLDQALQVGEQVIASRGADVTVQLVRVEQAGKLTGRDEVALDLFDITINGKKYPVATSYAQVQSDSQTARTGKMVGGTAAVGAIIGAIAGGGRGAAIGAATGAGAGAAVTVLTKGAKVKIPSESRLEFTLKQPLVVE